MSESSFWVKILSDGTLERGLDLDIILRKSSWTKGRQDIVGAFYVFSEKVFGFICGKVNGIYCPIDQRDSMIAFFSGKRKRISRKLTCKNIGYKTIFLPSTEKNQVMFRLDVREKEEIEKERKELEFISSLDGIEYIMIEVSDKDDYTLVLSG